MQGDWPNILQVFVTATIGTVTWLVVWNLRFRYLPLGGTAADCGRTAAGCSGSITDIIGIVTVFAVGVYSQNEQQGGE